MNYFLFNRNGKPITAQAIVNFDKRIYRNGKNYYRGQRSKNDFCWIYTGRIRESGYGAYCWTHGSKNHKTSAHRFSWMIYNGEIPKGKSVCHLCDIKNCVRPSHLWIGTQKDNLADMVRKGRQPAHMKRRY